MSIQCKILFVLPHFRTGGAERVLINILNHLDNNDFDVHLCVINREGELRGSVADHVEIHDLNLKRTIHSVRPLYRLVNQLKPDVVFSTLARCNLLVSFLSLCRFIRTKVIIREANTPSADMAKFKHAWLYRLLYRVLYRRADIIICQTNVMRDDLINHFGVPSEKAITIYNPVDVDRVREKFRSSESPFSSATNIVACGKLDHQKGFDILLDAFSKVKKQSGDVVLTIVGEGDNRIALEDQIDSLNLRDSVVMPGFKTNPYAYIGNANLFVLSSRWEGLPNVVLEAFALGIPVIAFDCEGGMKEIIIPAVNGILVPKESAEQLADAIIGQLKSPQTFDYDESLNKFSLKSVVQQYADTIQSLVP